jgi:hypothetical protein
MRLRAVSFVSKKWYVPSFCIDPAIICGVNILAPRVLTFDITYLCMEW